MRSRHVFLCSTASAVAALFAISPATPVREDSLDMAECIGLGQRSSIWILNGDLPHISDIFQKEDVARLTGKSTWSEPARSDIATILKYKWSSHLLPSVMGSPQEMVPYWVHRVGEVVVATFVHEIPSPCQPYDTRPLAVTVALRFAYAKDAQPSWTWCKFANMPIVNWLTGGASAAHEWAIVNFACPLTFATLAARIATAANERAKHPEPAASPDQISGIIEDMVAQSERDGLANSIDYWEWVSKATRTQQEELEAAEVQCHIR